MTLEKRGVWLNGDSGEAKPHAYRVAVRTQRLQPEICNGREFLFV